MIMQNDLILLIIYIYMGNCAKHSIKPVALQQTNNGVLDKFSEQPEDTPALMGVNLPKIDIRPLLRKVKVKNSPQKSIGVKFLIGDADQILLPEKTTDQNNCVRWEIEQNFQYLLTEYELRKKFLVIWLTSGGNMISTLKINMYLISIGPYHLDFQFPTNNQRKPRISFDFKMSQVVNMSLKTQSLQIYEMKQYVGEQYAFSMKSIFGNNPIISSFSPIFKIQHEQPESHIPIASWNNSNEILPFITASVPFYEFHYATLKYTFFKIDKLSQKKTETPTAECFISFVKLLSFDSSDKTVQDNTQYEIKNLLLQQKLWSNGKECGKVKLKIKFQIQKHLKQMLVCVRTQYGIAKQSPIIHTRDNKNNKQINKEITQLQQIQEKLINEEAELEKRRQKIKRTGQKIGSMTGVTKQSFKIIEKCLESQLKILQKSSKQTVKIYQYSNDEDLLKGQTFLVKMGERLIRYLDEGEQLLDELKWKVFKALTQRGQFSLNFMGFDKDNYQPGFLQRKKAFSLKFQEFNYKLLQITLKALGIKAGNEQKRFAEFFCAISYIKIPQFRDRILELIVKPNDPEIEEWRGTDFSLKSKHADFKTYLPGENTFEILFDWDKYFYDHIKNQPQYNNNLAYLSRIMQNGEWETRISHRRGAFFAFIKEWVNKVSKTSVRIIHSNWKHFPGYIQIIRSLMAEMKMRPVREYPPSIKLACNSLLANENLLNTFITIIFNKTSINDNVDVIKILDMTNGFLDSLKKQNKRIPSTFNYTFFYKGIKLVIQNLYSYSAAKALHLIYEQFDLFTYQFRIQICNYLLGRIFFKLFLHWSYNVRVIFQHLMIIKIYRFFTNQLKVENIDPETRLAIRNISGRYSQLLIILQNVKKIKSKRFVPSTENQLYKKLRNNLRKKKKAQKGGENDYMSVQTLDQIPDTNLSGTNHRKNSQQAVSRLMTQLAKPKLEKYDSQLITKDIKIALSQAPQKQKDEIIRKKLVGKQSDMTPYTTSSQQIPEGEIRKKAPIPYNTSEQIQKPIITQEDLRYIVPAMTEYSSISNSYLESIKKNKGQPALKMEIMLDSSQMKPEGYNDVDQW